MTKRRGENPTKKRQSVAEGAQSANSDDDPVLRLAVAKILMRDYATNHLDKARCIPIHPPLSHCLAI